MLAGSVIPQNNQIVYATSSYDSLLSDIENTNSEIVRNDVDVDSKDAPIVEEIESLRTENEKYFRKLDGTYEVAIYDTPVHYWNGEKWKEIDNTLVSVDNNSSISNKANMFKIKFPKELDNNKSIELKMDVYEINWSVECINKANASVLNDSDKKGSNLKELNSIDSSVYYEDVQENVDLEYIVTGTQIKENIILDKYINDFSISFEYNLKNLKIIEVDNGDIILVNDLGDEIFAFSKFVMKDNAGDISKDISYSIEDNGKGEYIVMIKPSDDWLQGAEYPVKVDPTIYSSETGMAIYDTYVYEGDRDAKYYQDSYMYLGRDSSYNDYWGLIYFIMPTHVMDQVITYSNLLFTKTNYMDDGAQLNIYKNTENFSSSTATWNNKPSYDSSVVDYYIVDDNTPMMFDITESVKEWQAAGVTNTTGFTIRPDDVILDYSVVYQNDFTVGDSRNPVVTIGYEEPSGLKDYWTYTSQDIGLAGTGYISDYTGNLTWVREEYSLDNEYMQMSLSFFFNNYSREEDIGYGCGWRNNFNMQVIKDDNTGIYFLLKPDGNKVFFVNEVSEYVYSRVYKYDTIAEDGSRMEMVRYTYQGNPSSYRITTTDHVQYQFDSKGRLTTISNIKTGHSINVYYIDSTSIKIDYVKDQADNRIEFTYSGDRLYKTELQLKQSDTSLRGVERRYYYYDSYGNINYINIDYRYGTDTNTIWSTDYNDKIDFYFDSDNKLVYAYHCQDDYKIQYSYNTQKQVDNILITDNGLNIGNTDVLYQSSQTVYTDYEGTSIYYSFDNYGHTINVMDDYGNCTYYKYSGLFYAEDSDTHITVDDSTILNFFEYNAINVYPNYYNNHNLIQTSDIIHQNQNPLDNHGFEEDDIGWIVYDSGNGSVSYSSSESLLGNQSMAINHNSSTEYAYQNVYLKANSYTLSVWIKNDGTSGGAYVDVIGEDYGGSINKVYASDGWERYEITFTLLYEKTIVVRLYNDSVSTAYFDNIQITEGFVDTRYNAVLNNSFEEGNNSWTLTGATVSSISENGVMKDILGEKALYMSGDGSSTKVASQDLTSIVNYGETYIIGAWAKADAVPNKAYSYNGELISDDRLFGIKVSVHLYEDGAWKYYSYYLPFDSSIEKWQFQMMSISIPGEIYSLRAYALYRGEGTAYFDNIQVYHDDITTRYTYDDENGNMTKIQSPDGTRTNLDYDENYNVINIENSTESIDFTRTSSYLVEEVDSNNVRTTFEYNSVTKQIITTYVGYNQNASSQDKWFKTSTAYENGSQYLSSVTDEFGNTTESLTNETVGLITEVEDAIGDIKTFVYDEYGNLVTTTDTDVSSSISIVASYEYDNQGRLVIIQRDGYYYEFVYDTNLNQLKYIRINDGSTYENMMSYDYWEETVSSTTYYTNLLKQQTYGNGDYLYFTYTDYDQVKTISFNGTTRYEYSYDSSGRVAILKDIHNSNIFFYSYDLVGRIEKITDKDGNTISYSYDDEGNLFSVDYEIGTISRDIEYHYDYTTGQYDYAEYVVGSTTITRDYDYDTDSLKRLDTIELLIGSISFSEAYEYDDYKVIQAGMGNATNRIYKIYYKKNGVTQYYYQYSYDQNQNITGIQVRNSSGTIIDDYDYYYDGFNQLVRENIKINSGSYARTFVYEYDENGNIESLKEHYYTTSSTVTTSQISRKDFEYNNTWSDQLSNISLYQGATQTNDIDFTYDDSGNPLSQIDSIAGASVEYTWDGTQLTGYYTPQSYSTYEYNVDGIRVSRSDLNGVDYEYVLNNSKIIVEYRDNDVLYYTYDSDGSLISMNYNGNEYFYITNYQGDVIEIVDINGVTVVKYKYDAWGNTIYKYDSGLNIDDINPFRYRSYYLDSDTGLYYLQSRYYNPEIGRFLSCDNVSYLNTASQLGNNGYTYTFNNPIRYDDSEGNFINAIIGGVVGGIWGGIAEASKGGSFNKGFWYGAASGAAAGLVVDLAIATAGTFGVAAGLLVAGGGGAFVGSASDVGSQLLFDDEINSWDEVKWGRAAATGAITGVVNVATFGLGVGLNKAMGFKPLGTFFQKLCQGFTKAGVAGWVFTSVTAPALSAFPVLPSWLDD
jgi:RHS repeat-associated protein